MGIWWIMFICVMLVPFITIFAGYIMWKHAPKDINKLFGYRTKRSMKNEDTWKFAHEYCGKIWWIMGWVILVPSVVAQIPFYYSTEKTIAIVGAVIMGVQAVLIVLSMILTEIALKKTFNDDGTRKDDEEEKEDD